MELGSFPLKRVAVLKPIAKYRNCSTALFASKTTAVDCLLWSVGSGQEEMNDLPRLVAALQSQVGR